MSYRITNPDKWKNDAWFIELSPHAKLLFIFLCDNCDNAGVYEINQKMLVFLLGITKDEFIEAIKQVEKSYVKSEDETRLWMKNYLRHQRMLPLNPKNGSHRQAILILEANIEDPKKFKGCKEMHEIMPIDPDKLKTRTIPKPKAKAKAFVKPTIEEVETFMKSLDFPHSVAESKLYYNYYKSNGWKVGKNQMKDWESAVRGWIDRWYKQHNMEKPKSKIDNIKDAHDEQSEIDWNQVYEEKPTAE